MNEALQAPGLSNAWTMPIKARIDMLTTGVRTPVGIKIYGADIKKIEKLGTRDRKHAAGGRTGPAASSRSVPAAATSSTSTGSATNWRATA